MARLLLSGYYGFDNFGDEAILRVFVDEWRRRRPDEIEVLSAQPAITSRRYDVGATSRMDWPAVRSAIRRADVVVSGGGGLLQTATSVRSLIYYATIVREATRAGRATAIFAQGVGPLNYLGKQIVRRACARVLEASVRDEASAKLLGPLLPDLKVALVADPVFLAADDETAAPDADAEAALAREGILAEAGKLVAFVVRRGALLERMADAVAACVDRLEQVHGLHTVFVPFQLPSDADAAVAIIRRCRTTPVLLGGGYDLATMSALFSKCAAVVSMRLHALILAARLGLPFLAMPYDPKISAMSADLRYPLPLFARGADVQAAIDALVTRRDELREHLARAVAPLVARASLAFDRLEALVRRST